jgi:hypothetical protein
MDPAPSSPAAVLRLHPDVVYRALGDSAVLVHLQTNRIFELNDTGRVIWERLAAGASIEAVVATLASDFDVDAVTARVETARLITELGREGLLAS